MVERGADPTLIILLANELQRRIGILPIVKVDAYNLPNESGIIYRILRVQPASMSEISRVIRAARTMKLHIRCIGRGTSLNKVIMMNDFSVVLDLRYLSDSERMEFVQVRLKDMSYINGLRVLAGVTVQELCEYQIQNQICIPTNVESLDRTIVGSIVSGSNGVITQAKGSLADYVIQVRILDIHGDVQTFTDNSSIEFEKKQDNTIKSVISSLGMIGVVYDVILAYESLTTVNVNHRFETIKSFLADTKSLEDDIKNCMSTQLIYIPYNSITCDRSTGKASLDQWQCQQDEIIVRTLTESDIDSDARRHVKVIRDDPDCLDLMSKQPDSIPFILKNSHDTLRRESMNPFAQYLPWAIHCFPTVSSGLHDLTISFPLENMATFVKAIQLILKTIENYVHEQKAFPVNIGVRVNFTSETSVILCPGAKGPATDKCVHVKVLGILSTPGWQQISFPIMDEILREIPAASLQWSSEWIDRSITFDRVLELETKSLEKLKNEIEIMDRDGVFLNDHLQRLFYPNLQSYRSTYKHLQNEYLIHLH